MPNLWMNRYALSVRTKTSIASRHNPSGTYEMQGSTTSQTHLDRPFSLVTCPYQSGYHIGCISRALVVFHDHLGVLVSNSYHWCLCVLAYYRAYRPLLDGSRADSSSIHSKGKATDRDYFPCSLHGRPAVSDLRALVGYWAGNQRQWNYFVVHFPAVLHQSSVFLHL